MYLAVLMLLSFHESPFEVETAQILNLKGVVSPTGVLVQGHHIYLTADLLESRPGLFLLDRRDPEEVARRITTWTLTDVQDLSIYQESLLISASRVLKGEAADWSSEFFSYHLERHQLGARNKLPAVILCPDLRPECGISCVIQLGADRILALRPQEPPRLIQYWKVQGQWQQVSARSLYLRGRPPAISSMRREGEQLLFLIRNRWLLTVVDLVDTVETGTLKLPLKRFFDLSFLRDRLVVDSNIKVADGLAEGVDIDEQGDLWVVINNRGYDYQRGTPPGPKLVHIKASSRTP